MSAAAEAVSSPAPSATPALRNGSATASPTKAPPAIALRQLSIPRPFSREARHAADTNPACSTTNVATFGGIALSATEAGLLPATTKRRCANEDDPHTAKGTPGLTSDQVRPNISPRDAASAKCESHPAEAGPAVVEPIVQF